MARDVGRRRTPAVARSVGSMEVIALLDARGPFTLAPSRDAALPGATADDWEAATRLDPGAFGPDGAWILSFQCFNARYVLQRGEVAAVAGGPVEHLVVAPLRRTGQRDVLVHAVQLANPDVAYAFEADEAVARDSRRRLLGRARRRGSLLATAHLTRSFVPVRWRPSRGGQSVPRSTDRHQRHVGGPDGAHRDPRQPPARRGPAGDEGVDLGERGRGDGVRIGATERQEQGGPHRGTVTLQVDP